MGAHRTAEQALAGSGSAVTQSIDGCLEGAIGQHGLPRASYEAWLKKTWPHIEALKADYAAKRLPLLNIAEETADAADATAALKALSAGASTIIFFGTGGSGLGGQTRRRPEAAPASAHPLL